MNLSIGSQIKNQVASIAMTILVAGCAGNRINADIETFHNLPEKGRNMTVAILPANSNEAGTLEFQEYSKRLGQKLNQNGYVIVPSDSTDRPKYVAFLAYGIDDGHTVTSTYAIPQWGVTGYSGSRTNIKINTYGNTTTYKANTTLQPQYGVTGYATGTSTSQIYTRALVLDIYELSKTEVGKKNKSEIAQVYQGKLVSAGRCGSAIAVYDALLTAMFDRFPGENGGARNVRVPFDPSKCGL